MRHPFKIEVASVGPVCVVQISGEIKLGDPTAQIRRASTELVGRGEQHFVFDMLHVPWLDSSGIGEVFASYKRARDRGGEVKLVLQGKSLGLFTLTELNRVFEIFDSREAALASYGSGGGSRTADA